MNRDNLAFFLLLISSLIFPVLTSLALKLSSIDGQTTVSDGWLLVVFWYLCLSATICVLFARIICLTSLRILYYGWIRLEEYQIHLIVWSKRQKEIFYRTLAPFKPFSLTMQGTSFWVAKWSRRARKKCPPSLMNPFKNSPKNWVPKSIKLY